MMVTRQPLFSNYIFNENKLIIFIYRRIEIIKYFKNNNILKNTAPSNVASDQQLS